MKKNYLVSWSGGKDSTYLIWKLLNEGHHVTAFYASIANNETKTKMELKATQAMDAEIRKVFPAFHFMGQTLSHDYRNVTDNLTLKQPLTWLIAGAYALPRNIDEFCIGAIMNDCLASFTVELATMWASFAPLMISEKIPPLTFPLVRTQKHEINNNLPKFLRDMCVFCEQPRECEDKLTECGYCEKCKSEGVHPKSSLDLSSVLESVKSTSPTKLGDEKLRQLSDDRPAEAGPVEIGGFDKYLAPAFESETGLEDRSPEWRRNYDLNKRLNNGVSTETINPDPEPIHYAEETREEAPAEACGCGTGC